MRPASQEAGKAAQNESKAWHFWPFNDIFGGSLAPLLVDTLGSPTAPLPTDPRALIANPHAAQVPPVHCALYPARGQSNTRKLIQDPWGTTADWLLINLGMGPWVLALAAMPVPGTKDGSVGFGIPGMPTDDHSLQCELRKHGTHGNVWMLEDIPTSKAEPRQLACVAIKSNQRTGGFCICSRSPPPEEISFTLIIPNVRPDGCCAQFFKPGPGESGLWEKFCNKAHKHLNIFEGTILFHGETNGDHGPGRYISVMFEHNNLFNIFQQPQDGPWRFSFTAPLSAVQALALAYVCSRQMPFRGPHWGAHCTIPRPITASEGDEGAVAWPHYWTKCSEEPALYESLPATRFLQNLIMETFRQKRTRDRRDKAMPVALHVVAVLRMENPTQWKRYQYRKLVLRRARQDRAVTSISPPLETMAKVDPEVLSGLDDDVNEAYLFHGTTPKAAIAIQASGFNLGLAGSHRGKMFGRGVYFAEESSKADEYAEVDKASGLCCMLFCRVICGEPLLTVNPCPEMDRQLDRQKYDSAIGDRRQKVGTYRELVVYDGAQAYAEYAVLYRRAYTDVAVAPKLVSYAGNGVADHLLFDHMESGELDSKRPISGDFAKYLKNVRGAVMLETQQARTKKAPSSGEQANSRVKVSFAGCHKGSKSEIVIVREGPQWSNLGVNVCPAQDGESLLISYLDTHGLIPEWNGKRQDEPCVEVGHHIVAINDVIGEAPQMIAELKSFKKGTVVRIYIEELCNDYSKSAKSRHSGASDIETDEGSRISGTLESSETKDKSSVMAAGKEVTDFPAGCETPKEQPMSLVTPRAPDEGVIKASAVEPEWTADV